MVAVMLVHLQLDLELDKDVVIHPLLVHLKEIQVELQLQVQLTDQVVVVQVQQELMVHQVQPELVVL